MRADTHTHVRNHRERANSLVSISARVCACVHSRRIYSLWHVRVLQPLKTYQSSANRAQLASTLDPATAVKTPPRLARDRTGRQDLSIDAGLIGFPPREMNFARSIPNYICLATNYASPFVFSPFVSFLPSRYQRLLYYSDKILIVRPPSIAM